MELSRTDAIETVHNLFTWLNSFSGTETEMSIEDISNFFTDDARMTLNGRFICQGLQGQLLHARDLQHKMDSWHFNTPFERTIVEGNTVVGYYTVDYIARDGSSGRAYDLCIWVLRNRKIAEIIETVVFDGPQLEVESFDLSES